MSTHNAARWLTVRWLPATARGCLPMRQAGWYVVRVCKCHPNLPVTLRLPSPERAERARNAMLNTSRELGT